MSEDKKVEVTGYKPLTDEQKQMMNDAKSLGNQLGEFIEKLQNTMNAETGWKVDARSLSISRTELQTAMMWLNRAIAQPTTFC